MVYQYNGILLARKDMKHWHMLQHGWPWKYYAKGKKSDPKATCLIPQNVEKREIDRNWKSISSYQGLGVKSGVNCKLAQGNSVG